MAKTITKYDDVPRPLYVLTPVQPAPVIRMIPITISIIRIVLVDSTICVAQSPQRPVHLTWFW